ncbi:hypothetical protein ACFL3D_02245 [Candidatus Omnitrophota bacterium]
MRMYIIIQIMLIVFLNVGPSLPASLPESTLAAKSINSQQNMVIEVQKETESVGAENQSAYNSFSVQKILEEAYFAMPFCKEGQQDWRRFNQLYAELKARDDVQVLIVVGENYEGSEVDFDIRLPHMSSKEKSTNIITLTNSVFGNTALKGNISIGYSLENIAQHVPDGLALIAIETTAQDDEVIIVTCMDNGTGFIYGEYAEDIMPVPVAIEKVIQENVSTGIGNGYGLFCMTYAFDATYISTAEQARLIVPVNRKSDFFTTPTNALSKNFGTFIRGAINEQQPLRTQSGTVYLPLLSTDRAAISRMHNLATLESAYDLLQSA